MRTNRYILITIALLAAMIMRAQEIKVKDQTVEKSDGSLLIYMTLDFSEIKLPTNRGLVCTPVIAAGDSLRPLTPVVLNGRDRHILYERTGRNRPNMASMNCAASTAGSRPSSTLSARRWRTGCGSRR